MRRGIAVAGVFVWIAAAGAGALVVLSGSEQDATRSLPGPVAVRQGGVYWGVYLSAEAEPGPATREAISRLRARGVPWDRPRALCDHGASEQLGIPPEHWVVSVYFRTQQEAGRFAATLRPEPLGIARVRTFCAD